MNEDIKQKTKIGMIWNFIEKISIFGISFILNVILARLLSPNDYGIIGILTVFLTLSNVFVESGFSRALIQKGNCSESDFSTTFFFNIIIGLIIYLVLFFAAPLIAKFYDNGSLIQYSRVLFVVVIINSFGVVQNARLQMAIKFKKMAFINFLSVIISGGVGIFLAYKGLGVWALIIQNITRQFIVTLLLFILGHWFPKLLFSLQSFKNLFGYGAKLLLSSLVIEISSNISNLLIGKFYTTEKLGYYTKGYQFPDITVGLLSSVLNNVTFPMLSAMKSNSEELISVFKKLILMTAILTYPSLIGITVLAENMISVILSDKWLPAVFFMRCIAISYLFKPLSILNVNLLNAIGRSDLFLKLNLAKVPLDLLIVGISLPFGVEVLAIAMSISSVFYFYVNAFAIGKIFKFGAIQQFFYTWKPFVCAILMGIIVYLLNLLFNFNPVTELFILVIIGIISYYFLLKLFRVKELEILKQALLKRTKRD